jgi:hypothetical protein
MQAIKTKYLGPTNYRGSRIKASCQAKSLTLSWDHALNPDKNHIAAAKALVTDLNWNYGRWIGGELPDGSTVFVCDSSLEDGFTITTGE